MKGIGIRIGVSLPCLQEMRFGLPFGHDDATRRGLSHTLSGGGCGVWGVVTMATSWGISADHLGNESWTTLSKGR